VPVQENASCVATNDCPFLLLLSYKTVGCVLVSFFRVWYEIVLRDKFTFTLFALLFVILTYIFWW